MHLTAIPIKDWPWGGDTFSLRFYSSVNWTDENGIYRLAGVPESVDFYQLFTGQVVGRQGIFANGIDTPATTLAQDHESTVVRVTGVLFEENDTPRKTLFKRWIIPHNLDPSTFANLAIFNRARPRRLEPRYLNDQQIYDAIQAAIEGIALYGMPVDFGQAILVDGAATVESTFVDEFSRIRAFPLRDGVEGKLVIPAADIVAGVSFKIQSSEAGDNGPVFWDLLQP